MALSHPMPQFVLISFAHFDLLMFSCRARCGIAELSVHLRYKW
jgi:hypothetical protein